MIENEKCENKALIITQIKKSNQLMETGLSVYEAGI